MKIRYSEIFYSIQGEGKWTGTPSVFFRTFGCNLTCAGFGQPRGELIPEEDMPHMKLDISNITSIEDLPVLDIGCDSSASWSKKYKHLQMTKSVEEVFDHITSLLPNGTFTGQHGEDIHLVITGGEPLLGWQRVWPTLLEMCAEVGLKNVTFETNGTQTVKSDLVNYFNLQNQDMHVTWSTSPKLSISGESTDDALIPEALKSMNEVENSFLYNKFVVRDQECLQEVDMFVDSYKESGVQLDSVYLMPEGATMEQQTLTEKGVADICMNTGYKFSPRLHISLFGNAWGT